MIHFALFIERYYEFQKYEVGETMFKKLNAEGTTILQVTHSDKNAAYGNTVINLLDGRITE